MNTRRKGNRNEDRSAKYYMKQGYLTMTSRASAGFFDVACFYAGEPDPLKPHIILVQSKTGGSFRKSDIETLRIMRHSLKLNNQSIVVVLHDWQPNKHKPNILLIGETSEDDMWLEEV